MRCRRHHLRAYILWWQQTDNITIQQSQNGKISSVLERGKYRPGSFIIILKCLRSKELNTFSAPISRRFKVIFQEGLKSLEHSESALHAPDPGRAPHSSRAIIRQIAFSWQRIANIRVRTPATPSPSQTTAACTPSTKACMSAPRRPCQTLKPWIENWGWRILPRGPWWRRTHTRSNSAASSTKTSRQYTTVTRRRKSPLLPWISRQDYHNYSTIKGETG